MPSIDAAGHLGFVSAAQVLSVLEEQIVSGGYAIGDKLPAERDLAEQFAVSRPVVREALRGLAERGLIEVYPGRGSYVREESGADLAAPLLRLARRAGVTPRNVVVARAAIECAAVEAAARLATPAEIAGLQSALLAHDLAVGTQQRAQTDYAFHAAIVEAAGNPVLAVMYQATRQFTIGMMIRSQGDRAVRRAGEPQHEQILQAIREQDAGRARDLMSRHITLAIDMYGDDVDRSLEDVLERRDTFSR